MTSRSLTPLGIMVKKRLKAKNMTQVRLAFEIGTSKQYLALILHGDRSGRKYLDKIAEICDIDLKEEGFI